MLMYKLPPTGWIWTDTIKEDDGFPKIVYFRRSFLLDKIPETAFVKLSADSRYRFYVNGVSLSFGPCKGDDQNWYFDEVDIKSYLKQGENVLSAIVLRYSMLDAGNKSVWRTRMPGFYLKGLIEYVDGTTEILNADADWRCRYASEVKIKPESQFINYLWHVEETQGTLETMGWLLAGYDDSGWQSSKIYTLWEIATSSSPADLSPRPIPSMYELPGRFSRVKYLRDTNIELALWEDWLKGNSTIEIPANSRHVIELDALELTCAFLNLSMESGSGTEIRILTSEAYAYEPDKNDRLRMPKKGDRCDCLNGQLYGYTDVYNVAGYGNAEKSEEYEPFWFKTFRYVQLNIATANVPLVLKDFRFRETGYPLEVKTHINISWNDFEPIWDISLRTLRRCMHETYIDCPFYEQLQYIMDTRSQILFTYNVASDDRLARRCIDDFHRSLRSDGLTECCWPSVQSNVIPGFSLYYIMMIYDHMMYFGDKILVRRYMPTVDAILDFFERSRDDRGLVGQIGNVIMTRFWSFVDWVDGWISGVPNAIREGPLTFESLLYISALNIASKLADYVGRFEQARDYRERSMSVKKAVNEHCVGVDGLYQDGPGVEQYSQHCQVWAILSDTAPKNEWRSLMEQALKREDLAKCSVAMSFYLFRAMEMSGLYDQTLTLWEPWRQMIRDNLTTCVENDTDARSDCHAWGSLMLYEAPSVLLGVRPAKPGYAAVIIKPPDLDWIKYASGNVITPKGPVRVVWERTEQGIKLEVDAPEGIEVLTFDCQLLY